MHEVLVTELVRRSLQTKIGQPVVLHTLEYLEGNPTRGNLVPRLVGFLSEVEREFFELICEVDGVGVRKALRAIIRPVGEIAAAIEEQDAKALSGLPGIGGGHGRADDRQAPPPDAEVRPARGPRGSGRGGRRRRRLRRDLRGAPLARPLRQRRPPPVDALREEKKKPKDVQDALEAIYRQMHKGR